MLEFEDRFRTEDACRVYLSQLRWPEGFRCPCCGRGQAHEPDTLAVPRLWPWRVSDSGNGLPSHAVAPAGVVPGDLVGWTNQKSGVSALGLQRTLGVSRYETAWAILHKLRRAMVRLGREPLTEEVEVEEIVVGGVEPCKGRRHVGETKALVAVAAEVRGLGTGRIRLKRIPDASWESLVGFVQGAVVPGG